MKIRLGHAIKEGESLDMTLEGLLNLTEGISVLSIKRPRLIMLLKKILLEMCSEA